MSRALEAARIPLYQFTIVKRALLRANEGSTALDRTWFSDDHVVVESGTHHINRQDADWPPQSQGLATLGNAEWGGLTFQGVMIPRDQANKVNEEPRLGCRDARLCE